MKICFPQTGLLTFINLRRQIYETKEMSVVDLTQLLGKLASTVQAILAENLPTILVSLTPPDQYFELFRYISSKITVKYRSLAGVFLMDDISNSLKRKIPNFTTIKFINDNRCLNQGIDIMILVCFNRGFMIEVRKKGPFSVAELKNCQIGYVDFHKILRTHLLMENQVTPACLLKILGTQNKKLLDLVIDI